MTIHSLPNEILSHIFRDCQDSVEEWIQWATFRTMSRLVCQHWNEVILSNPQCWSSLEIQISGGVSEIPLPIIDLWLERSYNATILVNEPSEEYDSWVAMTGIPPGLLEVLSKHITRIQDFQLFVTHETIPEFLSLSWIQATNLKSFAICRRDLFFEIDINWNDIDIGCITHAPAITKFEDNLSFPWPKFLPFLLHESPDPFLSNLTHFTSALHCTNIPDSIELLRRLQSARVISLLLKSDDDEQSLVPSIQSQFTMDHHTILHNLVELKLILDFETMSETLAELGGYEVLLSFIFPNLRILDLQLLEPSRGFTYFQRHISTGFPKLENLSVMDMSITAQQTSEFLPPIAWISIVKIVAPDFTQEEKDAIKVVLEKSGTLQKISPAKYDIRTYGITIIGWQ